MAVFGGRQGRPVVLLNILDSTNYCKNFLEKFQAIFSSTTAKIKINNKFRESFVVESGVKHGDPVSATLFSIVIDYILKQLVLIGEIRRPFRK